MARILHTAEVLYLPDADQPLQQGGVVVNEFGLIAAVGPLSDLGTAYDQRYDHQILMPGVVNAHIHLTDAHRRQPVPGGEGLVPWVRGLLSERDGGLREEERERLIGDALAHLRKLGTSGIGEVVNNSSTCRIIAAADMSGRLIFELIAFQSERSDSAMNEAERVRTLIAESPECEGVEFALGAHAPYSVSPALMIRIAAWSREKGVPFFQHLAEDPQERLLYEKGEGEWADFLKDIGAWDPQFEPPGLSPIALYDRLGLLDEHFVAVHLVDARPEELELLASRRVRGVLSPSSNLHISGRLPDLRQIIAAGITFGLGTDGRGSNPSFDLFDEARLLASSFPDIPAGLLLRSMTANGADILGLDHLGRFHPGMQPGLLTLEVREEGYDLSTFAGLERAILDPMSRRLHIPATRRINE